MATTEKTILHIGGIYNIYVEIGPTTVHFYMDDQGEHECPVYSDKNGNLSVQYMGTDGKRHRKSLRLLMKSLEDTSEFPASFSVPVRRQKEQRFFGDRGANHTVYKTVSMNKMLST